MITTPEEVKTLEQKAIDARNALTNIDLEHTRIRNLIVSDEYTLGELNKAKVEMNGEVENLNSSKDTLLKSIKSSEEQETSLLKDIALLARDINDSQTEKDRVMNEIESEKLNLKAKLDNLNEREKELSKRETTVSKREDIASNTLEIIKAFKASL